MRASLLPVVVGLATGIAMIIAFSIISKSGSTVITGFNSTQYNNTLMIRAASSAPISQSFLDKFPDANITVENNWRQATTYATSLLGIPNVDFVKYRHWIAYYNRTTGFPLNNYSTVVDNSTGKYNLQQVFPKRITNAMFLVIHMNYTSGIWKPDKAFLMCSTEAESSMSSVLGIVSLETGRPVLSISPSYANETSLIHNIQTNPCRWEHQ